MSQHTEHELTLGGCSPTPLASYLKALGILRLLAEQKPEWQVSGAWRGESFVIASPTFQGPEDAEDKLSRFLLKDYRPTPIVAPWNGGSGFYPKDNTKGIEPIESGQAQRYSQYRDVIEFCRALVQSMGLDASPKDDVKSRFITAIRGEGPDSLLDWMDAAILLAGEDAKYPPLLGTGGNDGRLDFTNNFMQRVIQLIEPDTGEATQEAEQWLPASLFARPSPGMQSASVGQFNPGNAGGVNAGIGFEGGAFINPWDFVLMLEGALFFAAASTKRLGTDESGALAYPFTVRMSSTGSGSMGSADEAQARAEMWLPLWSGAASANEIQGLLSEGRVTLHRRPARDGLAFIRAVSGLGVDRGIGEFQRYGFLMRSGKAYFATPLNRVQVTANPDAELIDDLEKGQFLDRLRRFAKTDHAPAGILSLSHQLENELFELAQRADRHAIQKVLQSLGRLAVGLSRSRKAQESVPAPPTLSEHWVTRADDGTPEFRLAAALAGMGGADWPMRPYIEPVRPEKYGWTWHAETCSHVWGPGPLAANVVRVLQRRRLDKATGENWGPKGAQAQAQGSKLRQGGSLFRYAFGADAEDVAMWLDGNLDEKRMNALFLGLAHARIPAHLPNRPWSVRVAAGMPAAYTILKPFFSPAIQLVDLKLLDKSHGDLAMPDRLLTLLEAGHVQKAVDLAWRRLRIAGFHIPAHPREAPTVIGTDGKRLLVALAFPLAKGELGRVLRTIAHPHATEESA